MGKWRGIGIRSLEREMERDRELRRKKNKRPLKRPDNKQKFLIKRTLISADSVFHLEFQDHSRNPSTCAEAQTAQDLDDERPKQN
jgi:hypothetical protein